MRFVIPNACKSKTIVIRWHFSLCHEQWCVALLAVAVCRQALRAVWSRLEHVQRNTKLISETIFLRFCSWCMMDHEFGALLVLWHRTQGLLTDISMRVWRSVSSSWIMDCYSRRQYIRSLVSTFVLCHLWVGDIVMLYKGLISTWSSLLVDAHVAQRIVLPCHFNSRIVFWMKNYLIAEIVLFRRNSCRETGYWLFDESILFLHLTNPVTNIMPWIGRYCLTPICPYRKLAFFLMDSDQIDINTYTVCLIRRLLVNFLSVYLSCQENKISWFQNSWRFVHVHASNATLMKTHIPWYSRMVMRKWTMLVLIPRRQKRRSLPTIMSLVINSIVRYLGGRRFHGMRLKRLLSSSTSVAVRSHCYKLFQGCFSIL
jgi:hypothetical protein